MNEGIKLLTGTVRRLSVGGGIVAAAMDGVDHVSHPLDFHELYAPGDQPDTECLVIIADDPAELRRVREMLEGDGGE